VKLLLDTHIWIWSLLEPARIETRVAKALENPANEKWLSPISIWECMVLVGKGRVKLNMDVEEWIARALTEFPPREAPLTTESCSPGAKFIFLTEIPPTPFSLLPQKFSSLRWLPSTLGCAPQKAFPFFDSVHLTPFLMFKEGPDGKG
jgi:PIN domain nuclease of toxin-antitoxin system